MIRLIFFAIAMWLSIPAIGCTAPRMGAEYNSLISIEKTGINSFEAVISKEAEGLDFGAHIVVAYYSYGAEHRTGEYWKNVYERQVGSNYIATFDLVKIEDYVPFLQVFWYPEALGLCGAYGKSGDLLVE